MTTQNQDAPPPRVAVLGTGSLGTHHARLFADLARSGEVEFTGVFDIIPEARERIARQHNVTAFNSAAAAAAASDALSIVTPTSTHFELAKPLLQQGKHLLVEKPMTDNTVQAADLVQTARKHNCLLQIGHVERFNPVFNYLQNVASEPRFIETHRLSPYPKRSTDVGVVLDLMIHDLDVVLAFVNSPVTSVDAVGIAVLSQSEDIANARLRFANGCVANLTASRISPERMRKIRVFSGGRAQPPSQNQTQPATTPAGTARQAPRTSSYISLDYQAQEGFIYRIARDDEEKSSLLQKLLHAKDSNIVSEFAGKRIVREPVPIIKDEPLKLELKSFIDCVRARQTPVVSGESARHSLDLAFEITRQIQEAAP